MALADAGPRALGRNRVTHRCQPTGQASGDRPKPREPDRAHRTPLAHALGPRETGGCRRYLRPVTSPSLHALLARAGSAVERGRGPEAVQILSPLLRSAVLGREDDLAVRSALAEAWLLQDDLDQASAVLGRTPDAFRDGISAARLSALWRLHGCIASVRGDQSRAIALHGRALKSGETAHDSRAIGLAPATSWRCVTGQVGDTAIVREHLTKASSALHAAGNRRNLALVHSLSSFSLAQFGRSTEAMAALRQAERLAAGVQADDVVAMVVGARPTCSRSSTATTALTLAERSVALHEAHGSGHGLAVSLATMGQILVRLGDLARAEATLHRALEVRSPIQFHETAGAVHDTLAQIHLVQGNYESSRKCLERARDAYGAYGRQTSQWSTGTCACCSPASRFAAAPPPKP